MPIRYTRLARRNLVGAAGGGGLDGEHSMNPSSEGDGSNGRHIAIGALRGRMGAGAFFGAASVWPMTRGARGGGVECIFLKSSWLKNYRDLRLLHISPRVGDSYGFYFHICQ